MSSRASSTRDCAGSTTRDQPRHPSTSHCRCRRDQRSVVSSRANSTRDRSCRVRRRKQTVPEIGHESTLPESGCDTLQLHIASVKRARHPSTCRDRGSVATHTLQLASHCQCHRVASEQYQRLVVSSRGNSTRDRSCRREKREQTVPDIASCCRRERKVPRDRLRHPSKVDLLEKNAKSVHSSTATCGSRPSANGAHDLVSLATKTRKRNGSTGRCHTCKFKCSSPNQ